MPKNAAPLDQKAMVPPIPPIPEGLPVVELEENALEVWRVF